MRPARAACASSASRQHAVRPAVSRYWGCSDHRRMIPPSVRVSMRTMVLMMLEDARVPPSSATDAPTAQYRAGEAEPGMAGRTESDTHLSSRMCQ